MKAKFAWRLGLGELLLPFLLLIPAGPAAWAQSSTYPPDTFYVHLTDTDYQAGKADGTGPTLLCPSDVIPFGSVILFTGSASTTSSNDVAYTVSFDITDGISLAGLGSDQTGQAAALGDVLAFVNESSSKGDWEIFDDLATLTSTIKENDAIDWAIDILSVGVGSVTLKIKVVIGSFTSRDDTCPITVEEPTGTIHVFKWEDTNGNREEDEGEPRLGGWQMYLDNDFDAERDNNEPTAFTNSSGQAVFSGLPLGEYNVREVLQPGFLLFFPVETFHRVTLSLNNLVDTVKFGNFPLPGAIHGQVYEDADEDGVHDDNEVGLDGVEIELRTTAGIRDASVTSMSMDLDGDGVIDPTTEQGLYWFENLLENTYRVIQLAPPPGMEPTVPRDPAEHLLTISDGMVFDGIDFGNKRLPLGAILGQKFFDADGDGSLGAEEQGLDGVVIELIDQEGQVVARDTTHSLVTAGDTLRGQYGFDSIIPDTYTVREQVPDGLTQTFPANPNGHEVTVGPGEIVENVLFGNSPIPGAIHGIVFDDADGNGVRGPDEAGLDGVTVRLCRPSEGEFDATCGLVIDLPEAESMPMVVAGDTLHGHYWLEGVTPGTYLVTVDLPEGTSQTFPSDLDGHEVTLNPGETIEEQNFGLTTVFFASIHGQKFYDVEAAEAGLFKGEQEKPYEAGIDSFLIELLNLDAVVIDSVRTRSIDLDGNGTIDPLTERGLYGFENLNPGTYTVREAAPGFPFRNGTLTFRQIWPPEPGTYTVTLNAGEQAEALDFGNRDFVLTEQTGVETDLDLSGALHVQLFADANHNGVRDPGEQGLDGMPIRIFDEKIIAPEVSVTMITEPMDLNGDGLIDDETERGWVWVTERDPDIHTVRPLLPPHLDLTTDFSEEVVLHWHETRILELGVTVPTALQGQKFLDANMDGEQAGAEEIGLNGWVIELVDAAGVVVAHDTTHSLDLDQDGILDPLHEHGLYGFEGLAPGTYTVREQAQDGFRQTKPADPAVYDVALDAGDDLGGLDFGNSDRTAIHGQQYVDLDGDGQFDADEPGLDGILIELLNAEGIVIDSTRTMGMDRNGDGLIKPMEQGQYWFENLAPGTYMVRTVIPEHLALDQTEPDGDGTHSVTLEPGEVEEDRFFGSESLGGAIHGQKFLDDDGDGRFDTNEPGLNGMTIELLSTSTAGGAVLSTTVTMGSDLDEDGLVTDIEQGWFWFEHLRPGSYTVREVVALPFVQTFPFFEGTHTVTVAAGQVVDTLLFGNGTFGGAIHGQKFLDANGDGQFDTNDEAGLNGVVIELVNAEGLVIDRDTTHSAVVDGETAHGLFWFTNLIPDAYTVREVTLPSLIQTFPPDGAAHTVILDDHEIVEGLLFGNTRQGSIHGQKFLDTNGDSRRNPSEPGLDGITIQLRKDGDLKATAETMSQDLDGDGTIDPVSERGLYWFEGLDEGDYIVREEVPGGFKQTFPNPQDLSDLGASDNHRVALGPAEQVDSLLFGNVPFSASIHGQVFEDPNQDGHRETDDPGVDGVTVDLFLESTAAVTSVVTMNMDLDGDGTIDPVIEQGLFWFEDLAPGNYEVALDGSTFEPSTNNIPVPLSGSERVEDLLLGGRALVTVALNAPGDEGDLSLGDGVCDTGAGGIGAVACTLRAALEECNAHDADAPPCRINPEGLGKRRTVVQPQGPLPVLTRSMVLTGAGTLEIDGSAAGPAADGLTITGGRSIVTGLTLTGFAGHGLVLDGSGGNLIEAVTITANDGDGIRVTSGLGNALRANLIFGNGGLGIDLNGDGATANDDGDTDDGANSLVNTPVLTGVTAENRLIEGTLDAMPNMVFTLEFFSGSACTPPGHGEAEAVLGTASVLTDRSGQAFFAANVGADLQIGQSVTATATDVFGSTSEFSACIMAVTTPVEEAPEPAELPTQVTLHPVYPNPFNPQTTIRYVLPRVGQVQLLVYNVLGQQVAVLVDGLAAAGEHTLVFDAGNLPSGLYFARLTQDRFSATQPMILLK